MWKAIKTLVMFLVIAFALIRWDIYRWHTFQDITNSDIGYWKWKFVIDAKGR
jgi:hypothetical protein